MTSAVASLEHLDGVGPQLAQTLRRHFGTDAGFIAAAGAGELERIAGVPGVTRKRAADLVRQVRGGGANSAADAFLATPQARRVHDDVLDRLSGFAATAAGRDRLRLIACHTDPSAARAMAAKVMEHKDLVAGLDRDEVRKLLRRIRVPHDPPAKVEPGRLVVADGETQERLRTEGVHRWVHVAGPAELAHASDYELVLVLDERELPGIDNAVEVPGDAPAADVAPESVLAWFAANRPALEAAATLGALLGRPQSCSEAIAALDDVPPSGPIPNLGKEAVAVQAILRAELRQRVAGLSVSGSELLDSIGRRLPPALQKAVEETVRHGRDLMLERTGVALHAFAVDPSLEVDEEEIERVTQGLRSRTRVQVYEARVAAARRLAPLRAAASADIVAWLTFDVEFALGCFALHYDLRPARFTDRLAVADSVHLTLADDAAAQRIAYRLGGKEARVALLTGANSGGKTTLLEHLAQVAIMARLGLPVVGADVEVPWVDEVHIVSSRRNLDAGAFESFLKGFLPLVLGEKRRLVLADEVEAVTELEAASRILGFFLERLCATQSLAVVVTHLAPQILARASCPVRVDGIEATGLDDHNRLVVDRTPRMGVLARSTPELIVQRLAATVKGPQRALYADLLAAFVGNQVPVAVAAIRPGKGKRAPSTSQGT